MATHTYVNDPHNVPHDPDFAVAYVAANDADVTYKDSTRPFGAVAYITVTGNVTATPAAGGTDVVLTAVPAFTRLPFRISAIKAATTADLLICY